MRNENKQKESHDNQLRARRSACNCHKVHIELCIDEMGWFDWSMSEDWCLSLVGAYTGGLWWFSWARLAHVIAPVSSPSSALVVEPANHDFPSPGWKIAIGSLAASALAVGSTSCSSLFRHCNIAISAISAISAICHTNYLTIFCLY